MRFFSIGAVLFGAQGLWAQAVPWSTIGGDAQHTGQSIAAAQSLTQVHWSTPVDTVFQGSPGELLIHYGTPVITAANTVMVPVRTSSADTFRVEARSGVNGALKYILNTDYAPPSYGWIPSYAPGLTIRDRYYYPCAGGTVCFRDNPDALSGQGGQLAFYGMGYYSAPADKSAMDASVRISTPIVADRSGNIFFGFIVTGENPADLVGGVARISVTGAGSWVSAATAAGDPNISQVQMNSAPALSLDHQYVYFGVNGGPTHYLVRVDATTLAAAGKVALLDPETGSPAILLDNSSASPTVGPDGDVFYGVFESGDNTTSLNNNDRGWMLHFDKTLAVSKIPGAFGWDDTASIVPRELVPSYSGSSAYLLFTKYNNYNGVGTGDGRNRLAVLDPNTSMTDPITGTLVMKEVITVLGVTPDPTFPAVKEWCINSAAIDLVNKAALVNSEDGKLYRWDFVSNTLSNVITLTPGVGEAYTPTVIGPDGTVYAINDAILFAVGN